MEIPCLKESLGWEGVLPWPNPHCNKQPTLQSLPKTGLKGLIQAQSSDNWKPSWYYWFHRGGYMKIVIALDIYWKDI